VSDVTLCPGVKYEAGGLLRCPFRESCRRFITASDDKWQSHFCEAPFVHDPETSIPLCQYRAPTKDVRVWEAEPGARLLSKGWFRKGEDGQWYPVQRFMLKPGELADEAVLACFPGQMIAFRPKDAS
jgi:hypothetical protein